MKRKSINTNLHTLKNSRNKTNMNKWKLIGHFGNNLLYAKKNMRRIIEPATGNIIMQYILDLKTTGDI